jgi:hypothetical protein
MKRSILLSFSLLLIAACCKEEEECTDPTNPNCVNYDPCYGLEKPSAAFIMEEGGRLEWQDGQLVPRFFASDVFIGGNVRFRSELTNLNEYKHTWYVGTETFTKVSETPGRNFTAVPRPNTITISHVIEYEPDLSCFPNDGGRDSVSQTFRLIGDLRELRTYGTFEGQLNDTGAVYQFQIVPIRLRPNEPLQVWPPFGRATEVMTVNFFNKGDTLYSSSNQGLMGIANYYKEWWFKDWNNYYVGDGAIDNNGDFEMHFVDNRPPDGDPEPEYTLKGKKID